MYVYTDIHYIQGEREFVSSSSWPRVDSLDPVWQATEAEVRTSVKRHLETDLLMSSRAQVRGLEWTCWTQEGRRRTRA